MQWCVLACAVLGLAACGGGPAPRSAGAVVDTVDGVPRVVYGTGAAQALGWTADPVFVVGDALAEDEYQFDEVSPSGLAGDAAGNVYVLDRQGGRVLKYGPEGRHLATYGRKGGGPGELGQPLGLAVGSGDTVWVTEFGIGGTGRLTGFPQEGGEPRVISYPEQAGFPSPDIAVLVQGVFQSFRPMAFRGGPGGARRSGDDAAGAAPRTVPLLRLDADLQPRDTIWTRPEPPSDLVQLEMGGRSIVMMMPREFAPAIRWRVLSDGITVLSDSAAYLLRMIGPDGTLLRLIEREPAPRAVTETDREAARERVRSAESGGGGGIRIGGGGPDPATQRRILEQRLEKMTFAELVPRIVGLRVDPQDRIWVGVSEDVAGEIDRIDIYDRDGTLLGELRDFPMPDVFLGSDRIGLLGRDELDVQQVTVLGVGGMREPLAAR